MQTAMPTAAEPSTQAQAFAGGPSTTWTGYCDTVRANPQTLAREDHAKPMDIPILEYGQQSERNSSQPVILNRPDKSLRFGQTFHQPRSLGAFSPTSLTPKPTPSTLQSTLLTGGRDSQSQQSTATYFVPRKPIEQSCDISFLPIPQNFSNAKESEALECHKAYPRRTDILAMDYSSISQPSQRSSYFSSP